MNRHNRFERPARYLNRYQRPRHQDVQAVSHDADGRPYTNTVRLPVLAPGQAVQVNHEGHWFGGYAFDHYEVGHAVAGSGCAMVRHTDPKSIYFGCVVRFDAASVRAAK